MPPAGLGKGRRRGVLPPLPLGEGWGEGGGRRGPLDLAEARPPSYAKVSHGERAPYTSLPRGETERGLALRVEDIGSEHVCDRRRLRQKPLLHQACPERLELVTVRLDAVGPEVFTHECPHRFDF